MIMHSDLQSWLIGFVVPPLCIMALIGIVPFLIMLHTKLSRLVPSLLSLGALCMVITVYLKCTAYQQRAPITHIPCNRGQVTLLTTKKELVLIDPGYLGQRINAASFVQYTLIPEILKKTGSNCLDHVIVLQPSSMTFQALATLCSKVTVKNIYLVVWHDQASKSHLYNYFNWKHAAEKTGTAVLRIVEKQPLTIMLDTPSIIQIETLENLLKNADITYPAVRIIAQIDNQQITLYSAKYAKKQGKSSSKQPI
jgi:hypothetical protein